MNIKFSVFIVLLFVLLTPGILLTLPPKGGKYIVALVHGIVFAVVLCLAYKYASGYIEGNENMKKMGMHNKNKK